MLATVPRCAAAPPARSGPAAVAPHALPGTLPPPQLPDVASYVLMDLRTGAIIAAKAPTRPWPPGGLAKLMTAYLIYRKIAEGYLKMHQTVPVSTAAWRTGGTRMFIAPGMTVTIDQLLHGMIIESGNDATVALAQAAAGTRAGFVQMMNATARRLGLTGTHYTNASGLPAHGLHTTARDVAILSRTLIQAYPGYLGIAAQKYYSFDKIRQPNWNPVLFRDPTVDGLQTGLTSKTGHCIDATALRHGRRLIAVVLGAPSWRVGTAAVEELLDYGYRHYADTVLTHPGKTIGSLVDASWTPRAVAVGAARSIVATIPVRAAKSLATSLALDPPAKRGVAKGSVVGRVIVRAEGRTIAAVPAVALAAARPAGMITRVVRDMRRSLDATFTVFSWAFERGLPQRG